MYDFDSIIDRTGTACLKYDEQERRMHRTDLLPLWVADMDFRAPEELLIDLRNRVEHGIFGYTDPDEGYYAALNRWFEAHYGRHVDPETVTVTPGIVYALATAVRAFTEPGDAIIIQQPVYYPFSEVVLDNGRRLISSDLVYDRESGRYEMDYEDFENKVVAHHVRMFILCTPHNPVGRVWTREELERIAEICLRHHVIICADEIHCDFIYPGHEFVPFTSLSPEVADITVNCTSASKTFNIAGLQVADIIIENEGLRRRFRRVNAANGYSQCNVLGMVGTESVRNHGDQWLAELMAYLYGNYEYVRSFVEEHFGAAAPANHRIRLVPAEGTYLLWLDCKDLGLSVDELESLINDRAHLWLDSGRIFGKVGEGFQRINIACPRAILEKAMEQLLEAVETL